MLLCALALASLARLALASPLAAAAANFSLVGDAAVGQPPLARWRAARVHALTAPLTPHSFAASTLATRAAPASASRLRCSTQRAQHGAWRPST
jgi:hypothetical protein